MVKAMQIICAFAMILDLIVFFTQGSVFHLFMAGLMFMCLDYWMRR